MRSRLIKAFVALVVVGTLSTVGLYVLGGGRWSLTECVYFTVITVTTVGYGETLPGFAEVEYARQFVSLVILAGMGTVLYFVSTFTANIIEGDLHRALRHKRMLKEISRLSGHVVVCGAGSTARNIIDELCRANIPTVAVDIDKERVESAREDFAGRHMYCLEGDATEDEVLAGANVAAARGVVCALPNDKDNLYLVVAARQLNADATIVARGSDLRVLEKLKRAGATSVVSPNYIGGLRMVSEIIRPEAVRFLDSMLRDSNTTTRIEEIHVDPNSDVVGKALRDTRIRQDSELLVLAVRDATGSYRFNPGADFVIDGGMTLVVLGETHCVQKLQARVGA